MIELGIIGFSKNNGHPYSFSAIVNGYNYKYFEKEGYIYFKYVSGKINKKNTFKKVINDNPFNVLKELSLK